MEDVERVDFLDRRRCDAKAQRAIDDLLVQFLALFRAQHLRIVETANYGFRRIENDRRSHDRTRQRSAPRFIDATNDVVRRVEIQTALSRALSAFVARLRVSSTVRDGFRRPLRRVLRSAWCISVKISVRVRRLASSLNCFSVASASASRRREMLQDFRHDEAPRQDIRQADIRQIALPLHDLARQPRHLVRDDHRLFQQRRFERHRAALHEDRVGGGHRGLREAVGDRERSGADARATSGCSSLAQRRRSPPAPGSARRVRRCCISSIASKNVGPISVDLRAPAARQHRDDRAAFGEPEFAARAGVSRLERDFVGERMADIGRRDARLFHQRGFEREHAQHVIDGLRDLLDAPAAPRPDRRATKCTVGMPALAQRLLEPEVEVGRVDADEHRRAARPAVAASASLRMPRISGMCRSAST